MSSEWEFMINIHKVSRLYRHRGNLGWRTALVPAALAEGVKRDHHPLVADVSRRETRCYKLLVAADDISGCSNVRFELNCAAAAAEHVVRRKD